MAGQYVLGAAGAISAYVFGNYYMKRKAAPLDLEVPAPRMEVAGGIDILPLVSAVLDSLPASFMRNLSIKVPVMISILRISVVDLNDLVSIRIQIRILKNVPRF
jgi:hypothetical protein